MAGAVMLRLGLPFALGLATAAYLIALPWLLRGVKPIPANSAP
jgi:hypothetical protein